MNIKIEKIKYLSILFVLQLLLVQISFAQTTWTGDIDTDWNNPGNWTAGVPTATVDVAIPNMVNDPIISTPDAVAKSVNVFTHSILLITTEGILTVNGSTTQRILNNGTIENSGIIYVGNSGISGNYGIVNGRTINNYGQININRANQAGFLSSTGSTFTNSGEINIGLITNVGNIGLDFRGEVFSNTSTGVININRTSQTGIYLLNTLLSTNSGEINIGAIESIGFNGILIYGTFTNSLTGVINVNRFNNYGLSVSNNIVFTNLGEINLGGIISSVNSGIVNGATFNNQGGHINIGESATFWNGGINNLGIFNNTGGFINIDNTASWCIINSDNKTFTNNGQITVGENANIGPNGIENRGVFDNNINGNITINRWTASAIKNISGTFNNYSHVNIGQIAMGGEIGIDNFATFNHFSGNIVVNECLFFGVINNSGMINNSAQFYISSMEICGIFNQAVFNNNTNGILSIDDCHDVAIYNESLFNNYSILNIGSLVQNNLGIYNSGTFNNESSGNVMIDNTTYSGIFSFDGIFSNNGILTIGELVGTNLIDGSGGLIVNNDLSEIKGTGNIVPTYFYNSGGTLSPGYSTGILTFSSGEDFTNSRINIEVDGITNPGQDFDQIIVNGTATVGADTYLNLTFSYQFGEDMGFDILTATSITGTIPLSNISFNNIEAGNVTGVNVSYVTTSNGEAIRVTVFTPIPSFTPFITSWKTDNPGSSNSTSITIPTIGTGYNYDIDWNNDGIFDTIGVTGSITHDYGIAGTYQIAIRGDFPRIYFNNTGDKQKLLAIGQWGDIEWSSMQSAFHGCNNLVYNASDNPDLSNVTNMQNMFAGCTIFNGNISTWNTQNVTNMSGMFAGASQFNQNIGNWVTQNVSSMSGIFSGASQFNQDISMWNTQNVNTISNMFSGASSFNQDISTWMTQNVTNMNGLFVNATSFNQSLGNWNIQNVTNMTNMLNNSGLSLNNYDNTLIGWASQTVKPNVPLGAQGRQYCAGLTARNTLVDIKGWMIIGDGINCPPTCTDGIQNGDEAGIDCGGSSCPPCVTYYIDNDNDMFGNPDVTILAHLAPIGYVANPDDCDDNDPEVYQNSAIVKSNAINNLWSDTNHWLCDMPSIGVETIIIMTNTIFNIPAATLPSSLNVANGTLTIPAGNTLTLGSMSDPVNVVVESGGTLHIESGGTLIVYGILHQALGLILNEGNIEVR